MKIRKSECVAMRIDYEIERKEYHRYFSMAQGIYAQKNSIKRNPDKKVCSYSIILVRNYLIAFLYIPFIAFFDTCINLSFLADLFAILLVFVLFFNTISVFLYFISYFLSKRRKTRGEIRLEEQKITDTTFDGKVISKTWEEIDFIYMTEKTIFIIAKKRLIFVIPESTRKIESTRNYLQTIQESFPKMKIIDSTNHYLLEENKWKKRFLNWGVYILLFILFFGAVIAWEIYNENAIYKEMMKIEEKEYEIDNTIYSYEKYGKVEKELKDFFHTYRTNYYTYLENSATGIMYLLNIEFLEKNKDNLKEVIEEFPNREKKTEKAIEKIIELANQEKWIMNLEKMKLGDIYINLFKEYAFSFANNRFKREWERELYNNQLRMQYLTRMVEILTLPNACWYIEDNNLYFCDDAQLKEYNELYDLLMEENKQFSSGVKM